MADRGDTLIEDAWPGASRVDSDSMERERVEHVASAGDPAVAGDTAYAGDASQAGSIASVDGVIDLRDPAVTEGLASVLAELSDLNKQVTKAEVRAAVAETERDGLKVRLRVTSADLDERTAQFEHAIADVHRLEQQLAVSNDRLERSEAELEEALAGWRESTETADEERAEAQALIDDLVTRLDSAQRRTRKLESVLGRRGRRRLNRLGPGDS